jgi:hypothetical protein
MWDELAHAVRPEMLRPGSWRRQTLAPSPSPRAASATQLTVPSGLVHSMRVGGSLEPRFSGHRQRHEMRGALAPRPSCRQRRLRAVDQASHIGASSFEETTTRVKRPGECGVVADDGMTRSPNPSATPSAPPSATRPSDTIRMMSHYARRRRSGRSDSSPANRPARDCIGDQTQLRHHVVLAGSEQAEIAFRLSAPLPRSRSTSREASLLGPR